MNDPKTDVTENDDKQETSAPPDKQQEASNPAEAFFREEKAASTPVVATLDMPIEAPADLDIDLINVPILTQRVEPEDKQSEDSPESDQ